MTELNPFVVTLNSVQGPSRHLHRTVQAEEWMLKQVQHDDGGECGEVDA